MKFKTEEEKAFLISTYADKGMVFEEMVEIFLKGKEEYVGRASTYRKSQQQKENWRKHRFTYRMGIQRAARQSAWRSKAGGIVSGIKRALKKFKGEQVVLEFSRHGGFEFLAELVGMEAEVYTEVGYFALEEVFIEEKLFAQRFTEAIQNVKQGVFFGEPVHLGELEMVLVALGAENLGEEWKTVGDGEALVEKLCAVQ